MRSLFCFSAENDPRRKNIKALCKMQRANYRGTTSVAADAASHSGRQKRSRLAVTGDPVRGYFVHRAGSRMYFPRNAHRLAPAAGSLWMRLSGYFFRSQPFYYTVIVTDEIRFVNLKTSSFCTLSTRQQRL